MHLDMLNQYFKELSICLRLLRVRLVRLNLFNHSSDFFLTFQGRVSFVETCLLFMVDVYLCTA